MIKSMTAYGRSSKTSKAGRFVVEIHSVNRKMLDISIYLPKELLRFDIDVRKWISASVERGQLSVRVTALSEGVAGAEFPRYLTQLKGLKEGWEQLSRSLGYDPEKAIDLPFLVAQMQEGALTDAKEVTEETKSALKELVDEAIQELLAMKENEGKALAVDIQNRLKTIEEKVTTIEELRDEPLIYYRKKLHERLKEVFPTHAEMEERVAREIALLAEKMDVTEELVRLRTHIEHFRHHLFSHEKAIGRTLDFLTQEMHREINTLGSKSQNSDISQAVIAVKGEIEKIREQVQNIE
ncbi:MAG: YicC/YloC family endoribonuclease [Chlamydiota bacterium]